MSTRTFAVTLFAVLVLLAPCTVSAQSAPGDKSIDSGTADVCDGRDNNLDGFIDEGCDGVCAREGMQFKPGNSLVTQDTADSTAPDITFAGNEYGIAWIDARTGSPRMCFARLDRNAAKLGSDSCLFGSNVTGVAIDWSGSNFLVAVVDNGTLYAVRYAATGGYQGYTTLSSSATVTGLRKSGLAWVGSQYVVTWSDNRKGTEHVYAALVNEGGTRTSTERMVDGSSAPANGAVVALGQYGSSAPYATGYGIAWTDSRSNGVQTYFARFGTDLVKVGSDLLVSSGTTAPDTVTGIAWTGSEYGIAFTSVVSTHYRRINLTRVGPDGTIVAGAVSLQGFSEQPVLVWTGAEYLLAWTHLMCDPACSADVARFAVDGTMLGTNHYLDNAGTSHSASVVWAGDDAVVTWSNDATGNTEIYANRMTCCPDRDGDSYSACSDRNDAAASVNPAAVETCNDVDDDGDNLTDEVCDTSCDDPRGDTHVLVSPAAETTASGTALAWSGSQYAVAFFALGGTTCSFQRLDRAGVLTGGRLDVSDCTKVESLVWTGNCWAMAYRTATGGGMLRLDASGTVLSQTPAIDAEYAWAGREYGGVFSKVVGTGTEWDFNRLDVAGNQLGSPLTLPYAASRVAWGIGRYGAVYANGTNVTFWTFDRYGLSATSPVIVNASTGALWADIAWTGTEFGITWATSNDTTGDIRFRRVNADGQFLSNELWVSNTSGHSWYPRVAWTGGEYGIAWQDDDAGGNVVYLARVSSAGTLLEKKRVTTNGYEDSNQPALVWTGYEYAIAYDHLKYRSPGVPDGHWETWFQRAPCYANDEDGDGVSHASDCNDFDAAVWSRPTEARALTFTGKTTLAWTAPASPGATAVTYDALRTPAANNFTSSAVCVESNDGSDTLAADTARPAAGVAWYYLVRAENACPGPGFNPIGPLGFNSAGQEISGRACP